MTDTENSSLPELVLSPRRGKVVLEHTTGPLKGMFRITGDSADAPDPYPTYVAEVDMLSHFAPASLVAIKRSHVLYREVADPDAKHFHEDQE